MQRFALTLMMGLFMPSFPLQAQSATTQISSLFSEVLRSNPIVEDDDWTYFQDLDNKLFLIDFESLSMNLVEIVLRNNKTGKIVYREDVFDLPVNSIYEFDYTTYLKGSYTIELRSFVRTIAHDIEFH